MVARACALIALLSLCGCPSRHPDNDGRQPDAATPSPKPAVIIVLGDGMGKGQLEAASYFKAGRPDALTLQALSYRGELRTSSASGVTDSAAAATAMACGVTTYNGFVGLDRMGQRATNLIERARARGWATGIVATSPLPNATLAGFTSHNLSRDNRVEIADEQVLLTRTEVMLGGGGKYFMPAGPHSSRDDNGLFDELEDFGYQLAFGADQLAAASPEHSPRLFGVFANDYMTTVGARPENEPTLDQMTLKAIEFLSADPDGFLLVVESSLIDGESHANDIEAVIAETLALDLTVERILAWAGDRPEVTLVVGANHDTGGLEVVSGGAPGEYPEVAWASANATNRRVAVFGSGPGCEPFDGESLDHRWVHALVLSRIEQRQLERPPRVAIPDGDLRDLRHLATSQLVASNYGVGLNQLDALHLDADPHGLTVGISGLFERDANATVLLIDVDFGAGSGLARTTGALHDNDGVADSILSALKLDGSGIPGFGADLAVVVFGGAMPSREQLWDVGGLRGLHRPWGSPDELTWYPVAIGFADDLLTASVPLEAQPFAGMESLIPWDYLYQLDGFVPPHATIAVAAILVDSDGSEISNQALPPFAGGQVGEGERKLSSVVVFEVDANGDWIADGNALPTIASGD